MFNIWPSTIYQQPLSNSTQPPVLPASLGKHPQQWTKHEVGVWLKWCSEEFCIEQILPDRIDMNGKALCLLKRSDFMERIPKNGDLLYNALQSLIQKNANVLSPMSSICNLGGTISMSPFIKTEPSLFPLVLTSANTQTTSMHAPSRPRPCVPILPHTQSSILPPSCSSNTLMQHSKHFSNTVSTVPGILSPAPSNVDTESASSDGGSVSDPEGQDNDDHRSTKSNDRYLPTTIKAEIQHSTQSAFQTVNNTIKPPESECRLLWEFIHQLLQNPMCSQYVCWENEKEFIFRINNPTGLAHMWGQQKNRTNMTYEKLSRALRYYYRMNIIKKVSGKRLTYKFMQQPSTIQKGQRGAKPHNKCDMPINRFSYPPFKEDTTDEHLAHRPSSSNSLTSLNDSDPFKLCKRQSQVEDEHSSTPPNFSSSNNHSIEPYDERIIHSIKDNHIFNQMSSNFQISKNSFEKNNAHNLQHSMVAANHCSEGHFSSDFKRHMPSFSINNNSQFGSFCTMGKRNDNDDSKSRFGRYTSPPTHGYGSHFKEEPQDEPEDLSLAPKKRKLNSDYIPEKESPSNDENRLLSKDKENNILPLLIDYKKTQVSEKS